MEVVRNLDSGPCSRWNKQATDQAWGVRERVLPGMTLGFDLLNCKDRDIILLMGMVRSRQQLWGPRSLRQKRLQEQGAAAGAIGRGWLIRSEDAYTMGLPWWSSGLDYMLLLQGAWIRSLVGGTKIPHAAPCSQNFKKMVTQGESGK